MSRVTEEDFDELLEVQFRSFAPVPIHEALFGPNTKEQRDAIKADFIKSMHSDPSDCWMKLVDKSNGRIVSGALWKIYPSWNDKEARHDGAAPWFEGEDRTMAEFLMKDFMDRRVRYMWNHPHVCECDFQRSFSPDSLLGSERRQWCSGCALISAYSLQCPIPCADPEHSFLQRAHCSGRKYL